MEQLCVVRTPGMALLHFKLYKSRDRVGTYISLASGRHLSVNNRTSWNGKSHTIQEWVNIQTLLNHRQSHKALPTKLLLNALGNPNTSVLT